MEETVHKDCNFYRETDNEKKQCDALTQRICNKKKCNFYMTQKEFISKQIGG